MIRSRLAFHCHHDKLIEYVYDYDKRVRYIKEHKPEGERELRLKLFKLIPDNLVPGRDDWVAYYKAWVVYDKAGEVYDKAGEVYDKAWEVYDKAGEAYDKAGVAYYKAGVAYYKAGEVYDKAGEVYYKKYQTQLNELHTKLCPDCPWDGRTIFGRNNV